MTALATEKRAVLGASADGTPEPPFSPSAPIPAKPDTSQRSGSSHPTCAARSLPVERHLAGRFVRPALFGSD